MGMNANKTDIDQLKEAFNEIDTNNSNYVHCAGGYRSMIACSILKRNGYDSVIDVNGGFSSIRNSNFKIINNV